MNYEQHEDILDCGLGNLTGHRWTYVDGDIKCEICVVRLNKVVCRYSRGLHKHEKERMKPFYDWAIRVKENIQRQAFLIKSMYS